MGSEVQKTRPCIVVSIGRVAHLDQRIVVPMTSLAPRFERQVNKLRIAASVVNGLSSDSAADILQVRAVAMLRFGSRLGILEAALVVEVVERLAFLTGVRPERRR